MMYSKTGVSVDAMDTRLWSRDMCVDIERRIREISAENGGLTYINIIGGWNGDISWSRNSIDLARDTRNIYISIWRFVNGGLGKISTNQTDDKSLTSAVAAAERVAKIRKLREYIDYDSGDPELESPPPLDQHIQNQHAS